MDSHLKACWSDTKLLYDGASMALKGFERTLNRTNVFRIKAFAHIADEMIGCDKKYQSQEFSEDELIKRIGDIQLAIKNLTIVLLCDTIVCLNKEYTEIKAKLSTHEYMLLSKVNAESQLGSYAEWISDIEKCPDDIRKLLKIARESAKIDIPTFTSKHEEADEYIAKLHKYLKSYQDFITSYHYFECEINKEESEHISGIFNHIANTLAKIF